MKELLTFRSCIFTHIKQDWEDVIVRAASLWSPQYRDEPLPPSGTNTSDSFTRPRPSPGMSIPTSASSSQAGGTMDADLVDVEEERLLDLFLPGQVCHIYSVYGQYKARRVPHDFPSLRRIIVQGNIFRDHTSECMYNALLEVKAVRISESQAPGSHRPPPVWVPYNHTSTCQCCNSAFTWHSTFQGEAQSYRERYNCRCCGRLVCGPCSEKRHAIPAIGLLDTNTRICDTCYYNAAFVS